MLFLFNLQILKKNDFVGKTFFMSKIFTQFFLEHITSLQSKKKIFHFVYLNIFYI